MEPKIFQKLFVVLEMELETIWQIDELLLKTKYIIKYRILLAVKWYICHHDKENIFEWILILVKHAERPYYILNTGFQLRTRNDILNVSSIHIV